MSSQSQGFSTTTSNNTSTAKVTIYTDGACSGNPGPGGWGVYLQSGIHRKELSGGEPQTTNNRMELQAAIEALNALKFKCKVELYTDSTYVKNGIQSWLKNWRKRSWRTSQGKSVKNKDLWIRLDELTQEHDVSWHWVKGHAGNEGNEKADALARVGMTPYLR
jgi:ribonuclease HI